MEKYIFSEVLGVKLVSEISLPGSVRAENCETQIHVHLQGISRGVFRREAAENCPLLGYYAPSSGNFLPTFRDNLSVTSSGFKNLCAFMAQVGTT